MTAFRIGFIVTLSAFIVFAGVSSTLGFFPPPKGPKAPKYPTISSRYPTLPRPTLATTSGYLERDYLQEQQLAEYDKAREEYEKQQETFTQDKVIPYAQAIFTAWIIGLVLFEAAGAVLAKFVSRVVGAAYAFTGVWVVLFGPFFGSFWFAYSLISPFARRAEEKFSLDPLFQTLAIVSIIGVVAITAVGIFLFNDRKKSFESPANSQNNI